MAAIEFDTVTEDTIEETCRDLAARVPGLRWQIVTEAGPGGWPVIRWTGDRESVYRMATEVYLVPADSAEAMID